MSREFHKRRAPPVVVMGCGAVGLPFAVALASAGRRVLGVDTDAARVERLTRSECDQVDTGLSAALHDGRSSGLLTFATTVDPGDDFRVFVVCVPTPASAASGFDDRPLRSAIGTIAATALEGDLVCIRSTVPIGATRNLAESFSKKGLLWAACPDRTLAGDGLSEQRRVPHLIGAVQPEAADLAAALFGLLGPVVRVPDPETAEAIKLFANVSRDVNFALANQFAIICEAAGIRASDVYAAGAQGYPRFNLARPGPVGGPCLTKDVHVLAASHSLAGVDLGLLTHGRALNESLARWIAKRVLEHVGSGPVAILGLAFKGVPITSDQRGAFGPGLAALLADARPGLEIRLWDPVETPDLVARDAALRGAAIVVLANDHPALVGAARVVGRLAPGATIYDLVGVLPREPPMSGMTVLRFGDAGPR